jgi:hypothetical protein
MPVAAGVVVKAPALLAQAALAAAEMELIVLPPGLPELQTQVAEVVAVEIHLVLAEQVMAVTAAPASSFSR